MIELLFTQYGSQIAIAIFSLISSAITGVTTYSITTRKNKNEHLLAVFQEILKENNGDKEELKRTIKELREIVEKLKEEIKEVEHLEINCEKEKGLLEVEIARLQLEINFLVDFWGEKEVMKRIIENMREKEGEEEKGKFFDRTIMDKIYDKIIKD